MPDVPAIVQNESPQSEPPAKTDAIKVGIHRPPNESVEAGKKDANADNDVAPIAPAEPYEYDLQPITQMEYSRIPLQQVPDNAETRNGVYVYRAYMLCDFFGAVELYGEDEVKSFEEADEETRAFFGLYNLQEKYWFGFEEDYFIGCSIWCGVMDNINSKASSTLASTGEKSYSSSNLFNMSRYGTWCEGVSGYGIGEYVDVSYAIGYCRDFEKEPDSEDSSDEPRQPFYFSSICIVNGYAENDDLWRNNSRVKTLKMYVNGELRGYIELEDTITPQYFALYDISGISAVETIFRFEIEDVYAGRLYDDTCLTGISFGFTGFHVH